MKAKRVRGDLHEVAIEVAKGERPYCYDRPDQEIATGLFEHYAAIEIELCNNRLQDYEIDWAMIEEHAENAKALVKVRRQLLAGTFDKTKGADNV